MAAEEEVARLVDGVNPVTEAVRRQQVEQTLREVVELLKATDDSFLTTCREAELAPSREALKVAFKRFNKILRFFIEAAPGTENNDKALKALDSMPMSERFKAVLRTAHSVQEASSSYKEALCRDLALRLQREEARERADDSQDEALLTRWLPAPSLVEQKSPVPDDPASGSSKPLPLTTEPKKRALADPAEAPGLLKKSKIPALASLSRVSGLNIDGSPKRRVLVTREKLRKGLKDPRGLLDLEGSSTHALERAKRLELLKSAGCLFDKKDKSFSEKLNSAILRLELGVGGNSVADSVLFGAKALSIPGLLSPKNLSDIENNIVDGDTT